MDTNPQTVSESPRRAVALGTLAVAAILAAALAHVYLRGGLNLENRVQHWNALRQSIQSNDRGRAAIERPDLDVAILADFLVPGDDAIARAKTVFETWRAGRATPVVAIERISVEQPDPGDVAIVVQRVVESGAESRTISIERLRWERVGRAWRLATIESEPAGDEPRVRQAPVLPEATPAPSAP